MSSFLSPRPPPSARCQLAVSREDVELIHRQHLAVEGQDGPPWTDHLLQGVDVLHQACIQLGGGRESSPSEVKVKTRVWYHMYVQMRVYLNAHVNMCRY